MPLQDVAGHQIYRTTIGHGPRRVLAIHCSLSHSGAWNGLAGLFEDETTFLALDLPGQGRSARWDHRGDYQDVCVQIATAMLDEKMDVIGHSFGATVALRLAALFPQKVRSLTLVEPVFFAVASLDDPELARRARVAGQAFVDLVQSKDWEGAARAFTSVWGDGRPWDSLSRSTREKLAAGIPIVLAGDPGLYHDRAGLLAPGGLDMLTMPCLLVEGANSPDLIGAINTGLTRRLPDARRIVVDGAGHMVPITHPEGLEDALRDLFARAG